MTNEQAKHEAIKKAWGDKYDESIDQNGWKKVSMHDFKFKYNTSIVGDYQGKGYNPFKTGKDSNVQDVFVRPKTIGNLELNNGWIKIEPDGSNLPTDGNKYKVWANRKMFKRNFCFVDEKRWLYEDDGNLWVLENVTHYKPITPELKPIY